MWSHIFQCKSCGHQVKMVTQTIQNPMSDRVGIHMSLFGDKEEISAYYHNAEISMLRPTDSTCKGILIHQPMLVHREVARDIYDPGAKVVQGSVGKVTDTLWAELPEELQRKLVNVLSATTAGQGGQGVKALTGTPKFKNVTYTYELKFLGAYGNHRCYGNKVGNLVEFSVYDPNGTLH